MAFKFLKGEYTPKNPQKYQGSYPIVYRSGWELKCMERFDVHPNVVAWQSETFTIPYYNPLKRKQTVYVPDFLIKTAINGVEEVVLIEVKPWKEIPGNRRISEKTGKPLKMSLKDQAAQAVNAAKWHAAMAFCANRGWRFQVICERDLFAYERKK